MNEILRVEHLSVTASRGGVQKRIIHDISFSIGRGEVFSIVGESGCGKTTLACAVTRLFSSRNTAVEGSVHFGGEDILSLPEVGLRKILRSEIRYLFQEPGQSLNPVAHISTQMKHAFDQRPAYVSRCIELLSAFGLSDHAGMRDSYPHQLSIGTLQRILLAMALAPHPQVLIADEPTSAIDSLVKYRMMDALQQLSRDEGLSVVFITHDLTLARRYADRIAVMSDGRLAEAASVK